MVKLVPILLALAVTAVVLAGCGNNESTKPQVLVILTPDSTGLDLCGALDIVAEVENTEDSRADWYVNDILGGDAGVGTITQTNPAHYGAPAHLPNPPDVVIKAVPKADASQQAICVVTLRQAAVTDLYVSESTGSDQTGTGCSARPVKSITRALQLARPGITIHVAPGTYDAAGGEVFPLAITDSISVVGDDWETCIIRGRCTDVVGYHEAIDIEGKRSTLRKFTLEQGGGTSEPWQIAIFTAYTASEALIDSIRVLERAAYSVIRVQGASNCVITNCHITNTGTRSSRGFEIVSNESGTIIRNCTVSGFFTGLFFNNSSYAKVEGCTVEGNGYGIELCCLNDEDSKPNPDFGGGAWGSTGGNLIRNNETCGLYNFTPNTIYAKYNTWGNDPPIAGVDYRNDGTGSVIWQ
jgi:hypothetical protein